MPTCKACNRPLSDPESIRLGIGPICRAHGYMEVDMPKREEYSDQFDDSIPFRQAFVMKRRMSESGRANGQNISTNVPHLVAHHSPDGYEFGYGGSGPADLALNACQLYLNIIGYQGRKTKCFDGSCWMLAWALHQDFKREFVETASRSGATIPFVQIEAWMNKNITTAMYEACADYSNMEFEEG